uniref:ATP synthase B chain n=1 Tax=Dasya binghamiae TaxID=1896963 RepID=A0A1C8XRS2_9FLOR|nr:ATP synthase B chain precursor [Dasya binghamiae]AOH77185.1 ATP synthase B chain precursor [Dasya binghamiae]
MNFLIFIIISIILISQDFLLFNEEFLILLCFIGFCWVFLDNVGSSVDSSFKEKSDKIQTDILVSYDNILQVFKKKINLNSKKIKLYTFFLKIKNYYLNFNLFIIKNLNNFQTTKKQIIFKNKLLFVYNLEQQFFKLITLLILTKIKKLVFLNIFYKSNIKISNFICTNKICLREYLKTI